MAELLRIESEVEQFKTELLYRHRQAEENRLRENQAAIQIQSWFRACKVRAYLSHLHKKAIIIQKIWRGFTARAHFRQMVKEAYFIMKMNFYEEMAVRIQRRWRGFFARKFIHNFYARKRYLEGVAANNELVRREMDEIEELQKRERDCLKMVREQTAKVYQAYRSHHLLSTKQCPGVLNPSFGSAPQEREQLLRQVKYQPPTRLAPRRKTCVLSMSDPAAPSFPESLESPWIKTNRTSSSILPPIGSKKQQPVCHRRRDEEDWPLVLAGLLREPGEVWEQRVNCPDLTLRLQTSYIKLHRTIRSGSMLYHQDLSSSSFTQPAYAKKYIS